VRPTGCYLLLTLSALKVNVKCNNDYSAKNDESLRGTVQMRKRVRKWDKIVRRDLI